MSAEQSLTELAFAFQIDRGDENTFDSGEFPKVIFAGMVDDDELCGSCGEPLIY